MVMEKTVWFETRWKFDFEKVVTKNSMEIVVDCFGIGMPYVPTFVITVATTITKFDNIASKTVAAKKKQEPISFIIMSSALGLEFEQAPASSLLGPKLDSSNIGH